MNKNYIKTNCIHFPYKKTIDEVLLERHGETYNFDNKYINDSEKWLIDFLNEQIALSFNKFIEEKQESEVKSATKKDSLIKIINPKWNGGEATILKNIILILEEKYNRSNQNMTRDQIKESLNLWTSAVDDGKNKNILIEIKPFDKNGKFKTVRAFALISEDDYWGIKIPDYIKLILIDTKHLIFKNKYKEVKNYNTLWNLNEHI